MNNSLRGEIVNHLTEWFSDLGLETHQIENSADQILDKVASKMPENRKKVKGSDTVIYSSQEYLDRAIQSYNDCLTEVKSILKGGTDE